MASRASKSRRHPSLVVPDLSHPSLASSCVTPAAQSQPGILGPAPPTCFPFMVRVGPLRNHSLSLLLQPPMRVQNTAWLWPLSLEMPCDPTSPSVRLALWGLLGLICCAHTLDTRLVLARSFLSLGSQLQSHFLTDTIHGHYIDTIPMACRWCWRRHLRVPWTARRSN